MTKINSLEAAHRLESCMVVVTPNYKYTIAPPAAGWKDSATVNYVVAKHWKLFRPPSEDSVQERLNDSISDQSEYEMTDAALEAITRELGYFYAKEEI